MRIRITQDGPYVLEGEAAVVRTTPIETEYGEPVGWDPDRPVVAPETPVRLCRCGNSSTKPFCDDSHCDGFDGTEVAPHSPYADRRELFEGEGGVVIEDDISLCADAGFCGDRFEHVWEMLDRTGDPAMRERVLQMVSRCPSGRIFTRTPDGPAQEPSFEPSVAAITDGPLWARGGIQVIGADGHPYEIRNRQTLCRCGHSSNKPFCDGTHEAVRFRDG